MISQDREALEFERDFYKSLSSIYWEQGMAQEDCDLVGIYFYELPGKSFLLEKSGSVVRFTPSFLSPASSPGVGMWVM